MKQAVFILIINYNEKEVVEEQIIPYLKHQFNIPPNLSIQVEKIGETLELNNGK